jgi:hypothetical protein
VQVRPSFLIDSLPAKKKKKKKKKKKNYIKKKKKKKQGQRRTESEMKSCKNWKKTVY